MASNDAALVHKALIHCGNRKIHAMGIGPATKVVEILGNRCQFDRGSADIQGWGDMVVEVFFFAAGGAAVSDSLQCDLCAISS